MRLTTALSALMVAGLLLPHPSLTRPSLAQGTAVPISRISFNSAAGDFKHRTASFVVPDRDTTTSAYGGQLRRYDVHIAKMIELTQAQWCKGDRPDFAGVYWNYYADDGNAMMGEFYISCQLAGDMVAGYGLGRPEATTMRFQPGDREVFEDIPVLNLHGDKIPKFMRWVQTFKPQRS